MASNIFFEAFPSPNGFGSCLSFFSICFLFLMILFAVLTIFCGSVPVR